MRINYANIEDSPFQTTIVREGKKYIVKEAKSLVPEVEE